MNMPDNKNPNGPFNLIYKGRRCREINSYKVWRKIEFEDGTTCNILYNEKKVYDDKKKDNI
jgi:hypothetical protein